MAITQVFSGSVNANASEFDLPSGSFTLSSQTADGIYQLFIDFSFITDSQSYRLRTYEKILSSSNQRVVHEVIISGVQTAPVYVTPALLLMNGWTYTIQQLTGASFPGIDYSIRQVA